MEIVDANIDRLREEISECEAQLKQLKADLKKAESERRTLTSNRVLRSTRLDLVHRQANRPAGALERKWPLGHAEYKRYGRQLIMPEVGLEGQLRLRSSRVLIVGAGGLGCPAAAYLAGAGVGTLGLVDGDTVEESNLHRQILHSTPKIGMKKVDSAIEYLRGLNPNVNYTAHDEHLRSETAIDIFANYDLVLDCTDNPASRYLISDACIILSKPFVSASALKTYGQLWIFNYPPGLPGDHNGGPCYRCMFSTPPPPETVETCGEGGILGPVVGLMGILQALEALKIITSGAVELGRQPATTAKFFATQREHPPLALMYSAWNPALPFRSFKMRQRRKLCRACSARATITRESLTSGSLDYARFCGTLSAANVLLPEERISAREYSRMLTRKGNDQKSVNHVLIDTREPVQFRLANIKGSCNIPLSLLTSLKQGPLRESPSVSGENGKVGGTPQESESATADTIQLWLDSLRQQPDTPIFTVCRLGNDSQLAVQILKEQLEQAEGKRHGTIKDIIGGLASWRREVEEDFPEF